MLFGWCSVQGWPACPLRVRQSAPLGLYLLAWLVSWAGRVGGSFCRPASAAAKGCFSLISESPKSGPRSPQSRPDSSGFSDISASRASPKIVARGLPKSSPQISRLTALGLPKSPPRVSRLTSLAWPSPLPAPKIGCSALSQLLYCPTPVPHILPYVQRHTERHIGTLRGTEAH